MGAGLPSTTLEGALLAASYVWQRLREHVNELFFGDTRTIAAVLSAGRGSSPYKLEAGLLADTPTQELTGPERPLGTQLYNALRTIALDQ